jgi:hypothetical protein
VDIGPGRILRLDLASGEWEEATQFKGNPNGLAIARDGRIMIADYAEGILAYDPTAGVVPHLARRNLERFKGPNDLIVASNGDLCELLAGGGLTQTSRTRGRRTWRTRRGGCTASRRVGSSTC